MSGLPAEMAAPLGDRRFYAPALVTPLAGLMPVSYTHLPLPTNRNV